MSVIDTQKKKEATALRKQAYQQTFNIENVFSQRVIKDLALFCHANQTTFDPAESAREHAVREGRRQVYLRIQQHIQLTPEQLLRILGG